MILYSDKYIRSILVACCLVICSGRALSQEILPPRLLEANNSFSQVERAPIRMSLQMNKEKDDGIKVSDILSALALAASISGIWLTVYLNRTNNLRSIKEAFWMREVLIPRFLNRFFSFLNDAPTAFRASNNLGDFYSTYALTELNDLEDASVILSAGVPELGEKVANIIGEFNDEIMSITDESDFSRLLTDFSLDVVSTIREAQLNLSK